MAHSTSEDLRKKLSCPTFQAITVDVVYYHYKDQQALYKVLALGFQEANEEPCVIYQSLTTQLVWVRTISSWLEPVYYNNSWVSRFTPLQEKV
jgi:hypothetical protein